MLRRKKAPEEPSTSDEKDKTELAEEEETSGLLSSRTCSCLGDESLSQLAPLHWLYLVLVVVVVLLLRVCIRLEMHRLPSVPDPTASFGIAPENVDKFLLDSDEFVTVRARLILNNLTSFGVRPVGSAPAEKRTVQWLVHYLEKLKKQESLAKGSTLNFTVDQVTGWFSLRGQMSSAYMNVTNVIARVDPIDGDRNNTLLMNCHFDSMFDAMAASDDGVQCAAMLEIIRALMSAKTPLKHSVIFLFNGGEENILLASHGFVAGNSKDGGSEPGHPWSKQVRAFINLEAAGSGGRELLFQTGPGPATPVLIRAYAAGAPYPYGNVVGQEIFQAGLIPSDTDFRIFRDYGHIPGIDIAFISNGYVYHTKYDTPERIADGTIQRAGANYFGVVRHLASSDLSSMPPVTDPNDRSGEKLVYFDVFSLFMILYPYHTVGLALNITVVVGTFLRLAWRIFRGGFEYVKIFTASFFTQLISAVVASGFVLGIAYLIGLSPACMFWYSKPWMLLPVYVLPFIIAAFLVHALFFRLITLRISTTADYSQKCKAAYDCSFDSTFLIVSAITVAFSAIQLAMSYVAVIYLGWPLLFATLLDICVPVSRIKLGIWLVLRHSLLTLLPTFYYFYVSDPLLDMFIPISGRSGVFDNPEMMIAAIVMLVMLAMLFLHASFIFIRCSVR